MELPVNFKFCFEGMEESGSEGLDKMLMERKDTKFMKEVDYCCISDNYWLGKNKPCLTYGLRGVCYFFIEVFQRRRRLTRQRRVAITLYPWTKVTFLFSRLSALPRICTVVCLEALSMKASLTSSG